MATTNLGTNTVQLPQGSIKVAAAQFLKWAHSHSVLTPDAYFPGDGIGNPDFGPDGVAQVAISTLRQRQIRFVGVNEADQHIHVHLRRAAPTLKEMRSLPATCNGFPLRYHQGNPQTITPAAVAQANTTCTIHQSGLNRFYTCGSSIYVGNDRGAGTLGALLQDAGGVVYGLSNNHVSGSCNYAPVGLPIVAPGVLDVSPFNPTPFTIGTHSRQLVMRMGDPSAVECTENSDAAVFQLVPDAPVSSMQRNYYDTPPNCMDLATGMVVEKVGRSSDRTIGVVRAEVIGPIPVTYSAPQYEFSGQVYFEPVYLVSGQGDRFSEAGDSGSLVTHVDGAGVRHAVGIVFAGCDDSSAPGQKCSFVLPLRPILERLQLSLLSNHNC